MDTRPAWVSQGHQPPFSRPRVPTWSKTSTSASLACLFLSSQSSPITEGVVYQAPARGWRHGGQHLHAPQGSWPP